MSISVMSALYDVLKNLLGLSLDPTELELRHMAWRSAIVFLWAIIAARLADRRFLGASAIFDVMMSVIFASVLSRAINGDAAFFPSMGAALVLVLLHRALGILAFNFHKISVLLKGRQHVLVRNGQVDQAAMRRNRITADDLEENLRVFGNLKNLDQVAEARLERSGTISVVHADDKPGTVESQRQEKSRNSTAEESHR
jgi:uncharacterized membrane protein YcaP (DUF421 family)